MSEFKINVKRITVVRQANQTDKVIIDTDLPSSAPFYSDPTHFTVYAQKGYGEEWAIKTFPGVSIEIAGNS